MKAINSFFYTIYYHVYLDIIQDLDRTNDNLYVKRILQLWFTVIVTLAVIGISYAVTKIFVMHLILGLPL